MAEPSSDATGDGRFLAWRRSRPFWAGLWTLLGGLLILAIPLSDIADFLQSGSSGVTTLLPGLVLLLCASFMWFSPANRTLAGVLAVLFAIASLVLSNLGGLVIGMLLGILGGAMAVSWTDQPRRERHQDPLALVLIAVSLSALVLSTQATPAALADDERLFLQDLLPQEIRDMLPPVDLPDDVPRDLVSDLPVIRDLPDLPKLPDLPRLPDLPLVPDLPDLRELPTPQLLEPTPSPTPTEASPSPTPSPGRVAARTATSDPGFVAPLRRSLLTIVDLDVVDFAYMGTVEYPTIEGTVTALEFEIGAIDAKTLEITMPTSDGHRFRLSHGEGTSVTGTDVILDCTSITLTIESLATPIPGVVIPLGTPVTFTSDNPNDPLLLTLMALPPQALTVSDVVIDLVTLSATNLSIPQPLGDVS